MKKFLCATALLSIFLTPFSSKGDVVNPNADPKPCRIMVEQIKAFAKIDPLKGVSDTSFTDWAIRPDTQEEKQMHFMQRAFAPGVGKSFFYQPMIGRDNLKEYMKRHKMDFVWHFDIDDSYPYTPRFYDLSDSSKHFLIAYAGGTAHCIWSQLFKVLDKKDHLGLFAVPPAFREGDLCAPSDLAIMNIAGKDYLVANNTLTYEAKTTPSVPEGSFEYDIAIYDLGAEKSKASCGLGIIFKYLNTNEGRFMKTRSRKPFWNR